MSKKATTVGEWHAPQNRFELTDIKEKWKNPATQTLCVNTHFILEASHHLFFFQAVSYDEGPVLSVLAAVDSDVCQKR